MDITFITTNPGKWKTADTVFTQYGHTLRQQALETPEIQTMDVTEVAAFSARHAASQLGIPVLVTDVAYRITALGGFPGPFIKFINQTLSSQDLLNLMAPYGNREAIIEECMAYAAPGAEPVTFLSRHRGQLARQVNGTGSTIDNIMVLDAFTTTVATTPKPELEAYWATKLNHYHDCARYLSTLQP